MRDANVLKLLLYCHKCFTFESDQKYIGECMHILCVSCFKPSHPCVVCNSTNSFILLKSEFIQKILQNPSESFQEPLDSLMFQLSSAMNLILYQRNEINKLKRFAKRAKDEIIKLRMLFKSNHENKQKGLFTFKKEIKNENNEIKNKVDEIFRQEQKQSDKYLKQNVEINKKCNLDSFSIIQQSKGSEFMQSGNKSKASMSGKTKNSYLMGIANKNRNINVKNFNPCDRSVSSSINTRVTLPQKKPENKYLYRRQNRF